LEVGFRALTCLPPIEKDRRSQKFLERIQGEMANLDDGGGTRVLAEQI
jgi:hypothetical protein